MSKNTSRRQVISVSVSQNFLTSTRIIRRLLHLTSINASDHVIEIGAGKGHITRQLIRECRKVSAYEIDCGLYRHLQDAFRDADNLSVRCQDFLSAPLPRNGCYKVFSNIPFCITSAILHKLTTASNPPQEAWLVMEKGAAKRFLGKPHDTLSSVLIKPYFDSEIVYHFSRQDFHPMPSVDVVLLHLSRKAQPDIPPSERGSFVDFVETGMRYGIYRQLTKRQVATALKLVGLPHIQESGTVLYVQWLCLFRCHHRLHGGP